MKNTKKLTFSAICCALSVALMFVASLVTTGTLAFQFAVGLLLMLTVWRCGIFYGISSFAATALLLFLLLPDKANAISYTLFFGIIPIIKFFAEKHSRIVEWIIKLIFMNIFIFALYLVFKSLISANLPIPLLWLAALAVAVGYDLLLSYGFTFASRYLKKTLT
ncbi:MAG: hypothetical protein IKW02_00600 [Clostridia bacterium]|nr:hypothetical protein [Clostridia bacterium]